ncbi:hypothetical protein FAM21834_01319 [Lentilactobacillus parabuchneri]|jgi:VIT1/CCC1 family predicted Fe2+/Mn2+ transporter|uniref:Uncharacterized protein n=2 Tax=Lentilactobacillus parabuchneri TaxID=152331 RepID=A0A1X1FFE2_9LACO|nr:hypothetical protein [Lentilactobacillus parabuchneri]APR07446.1 hypothetical protein FAM21731_01261 [Lentilactobacillus parabuchneri]MBW0223787.1 hypothetical protein [Lentilactobacillus parabuchneri]MBW0246574.1 hypothetical protein [Lentilactobacillus parabuchneri]MBW0264660.1 hypothetical protein [Lentilactobacillus parabuchneri]MCT2883713.1 hypothetical protein [Lentilactobacillus parabuchneri]
MGFYIMFVLAIFGIFILVYGFKQKERPAVRNIFVGVGVMILIFAILAATPWGADILLNMFH